MFFSIVLMGLVSPRLIGISLVLLAIGVPIYTFFSPQKELTELKDAFWSPETISPRAYLQGHRFLAHPLRAIKRLMRRRSAFSRAVTCRQSSIGVWPTSYTRASLTLPRCCV